MKRAIYATARIAATYLLLGGVANASGLVVPATANLDRTALSQSLADAKFIPLSLSTLNPELDDPAISNIGWAWFLSLGLSNMTPDTVQSVEDLIQSQGPVVKTAMYEAVGDDINAVKQDGSYFVLNHSETFLDVRTGTYFTVGSKVRGTSDDIFLDYSQGKSDGTFTFEFRFDELGKVLHFAHYAGMPDVLEVEGR